MLVVRICTHNVGYFENQGSCYDDVCLTDPTGLIGSSCYYDDDPPIVDDSGDGSKHKSDGRLSSQDGSSLSRDNISGNVVAEGNGGNAGGPASGNLSLLIINESLLIILNDTGLKFMFR
jgi:hypothetical protein